MYTINGKFIKEFEVPFEYNLIDGNKKRLCYIGNLKKNFEITCKQKDTLINNQFKKLKLDFIFGYADAFKVTDQMVVFSTSEHFSHFPKGHANRIDIIDRNNKQHTIHRNSYDIRDLIVDDKYLYVLYAGERLYNGKVSIFLKNFGTLVDEIQLGDVCYVDRLDSFQEYLYYSHGCDDSREMRFWDFYKKDSWKFLGSMLEEDYDENTKTSQYYQNEKLRKIAKSRLSYFPDELKNEFKKIKWLNNFFALNKRYSFRRLYLYDDILIVEVDNEKSYQVQYLFFNQHTRKNILTLNRYFGDFSPAKGMENYIIHTKYM